MVDGRSDVIGIKNKIDKFSTQGIISLVARDQSVNNPMPSVDFDTSLQLAHSELAHDLRSRRVETDDVEHAGVFRIGD